MKNTIVLIDGFNLYYGLLRGTPWKWLDLIAFSQALLGNDHHILAVKYFTSPVKTHPHDLAAIDRQKTYLHALAEMGQVRTTLGFYSKRNAMMPATERACQSCATADKGLVRVIKLVFNPHPGLSQHLKRAASYYKNIPRDLPARCQLPEAIPVGTHGNVIRCPEAWKL